MKKSDADLAKQLAAIRQSRTKKNKTNPSSAAATKQTTLDGKIIDNARGSVTEPPPKRQRKPKAKPVAEKTSQQEEIPATQEEMAGNNEQAIGDQTHKATENVTPDANTGQESTGSKFADALR